MWYGQSWLEIQSWCSWLEVQSCSWPEVRWLSHLRHVIFPKKMSSSPKERKLNVAWQCIFSSDWAIHKSCALSIEELGIPCYFSNFDAWNFGILPTSLYLVSPLSLRQIVYRTLFLDALCPYYSRNSSSIVLECCSSIPDFPENSKFIFPWKMVSLCPRFRNSRFC